MKPIGLLSFGLLLTSIQAKRLGTKKRKISTVNEGRLIQSNRFPLLVCEGHCQNDSDCARGLRCFRRTTSEYVPGCGVGDMGVDYCYDPSMIDGVSVSESSDSLTLAIQKGVPLESSRQDDSPSDPHSFGASDSKTNRSLIISPFFLVSEDVIDPAPKPTSEPSKTTVVAHTGMNLTSVSSDKPELDIVEMDGEPSSAFPLQKCQGHCWGDDDCEAGLVCFKMFEPGPIPGCSGEGEPDRGYCFDVADYPPDGQGEGPGFRLKMYWQEGYFWQEETFDRKWCMRCDSYCVVDHCSSEDVSRFEFVNNTNGTQIKIDDTDNCFQLWMNISIVIQPCNASDSNQLFEGDFQNYRFEIDPFGMNNGCLSVPHHPKDGEIVYAQDCDLPRQYKTTYWNIY